MDSLLQTLIFGVKFVLNRQKWKIMKISIAFNSVLIGLSFVFLSCSGQYWNPKENETEPEISLEEEVDVVEEEMEDYRIISTDSNFTLALIKTVAVLPSGYDYFSKDSIIMSCIELSRIDSSAMLISQYITESWSKPEYYLTAYIKSKEVFASSSYGLFVFEPKKIKFYFSSDTFSKVKDSTTIVIAYDSPHFGHDMNGNPQIFIEFKVANFQNKIQNKNLNIGRYPIADKKWFLSKGIQQGVYRMKNEVYTIE